MNPPALSRSEAVTLPDQLLHLARGQGYLLYDDLLAEISEIEENLIQKEKL